MQIVSDAEKALLNAYAKITITAYIDGEQIDAGLGGCEYSPACGSDEEFSFGNACAAGMALTIATSMPELKGKRIAVTWRVDATEHPLFSGWVEHAIVSAGRTSVEAWDDMFYGGSEIFTAPYHLLTHCAAADAFAAVAAQMGVEVEQATIDMLSGITIPDGLTDLSEEISCSEVAGHIAGLVGGNAVMSRLGLLAVRQYAQIDWQTEPYSGEARAEGNDFVVSGVTMQRPRIITTKNADGTESEENIVLEFGAGDGTLMVENPLAGQESADLAFANLDGLTVRPGSYGFPGGILLEPGDVFTVKSMDGNYSVAAVVVSMTIDGGVRTTVTCGGSNVSGGAIGKINQALQTLMADYARIKQLVAENAQIVSARISNLTADDITAGRIRSTDYETAALQPVYPVPDLYPSDVLFPNNGEQITRGIEIDFAAGIIRGALWSEAMADLEAAVISLETQLSYMDNAVNEIAEANADLQRQASEMEQIISENQVAINNLEEQLNELQADGLGWEERLTALESALVYPKSM